MADDDQIKADHARWEYLHADPEGVRALLLLLLNGKGTHRDFDTMVDRIIESRRGAGKSVVRP